jgi:hypothetical protein
LGCDPVDERRRRVDAVIDWLISKNRSGYRMVNSVRRALTASDWHA